LRIFSEVRGVHRRVTGIGAGAEGESAQNVRWGTVFRGTCILKAMFAKGLAQS